MTGPRGPDEFKASDERGVKESQVRTEIASERLVNLQDERPERSLFKTIWTFLVLVSVRPERFKAAGGLALTFLPVSQALAVAISLQTPAVPDARVCRCFHGDGFAFRGTGEEELTSTAQSLVARRRAEAARRFSGR